MSASRFWSRAKGEPMLGISIPFDGEAATSGNGTMVAVNVGDKAMVDSVYGKALEAGGQDEGAPGRRGSGNFYGGYFRGSDGKQPVVYCVNRWILASCRLTRCAGHQDFASSRQTTNGSELPVKWADNMRRSLRRLLCRARLSNNGELGCLNCLTTRKIPKKTAPAVHLPRGLRLCVSCAAPCRCRFAFSY